MVGEIPSATHPHPDVEAIVLGYGSIGHIHCEALRQLGAKVVAVVDPVIRPRFPTKHCTDWRPALEELAGGRVVVIASPSRFHATQAKVAAECGATGILVEKPPALDAGTWEGAMQFMSRFPARVVVGFNWRFHAATWFLLSEHRKATNFDFLSVDDVVAWPTFRKDGYMISPHEGGVMLTSVVHAIDLALFLLGPAVSVRAMSAKGLGGLSAVDCYSMLEIMHKGGKRSVINQSWTGGPSYSVVTTYKENESDSVRLVGEDWGNENVTMHLRLMDEALIYFATGEAGGLCTPEQALDVMRVVDAARLSDARHAVVSL